MCICGGAVVCHTVRLSFKGMSEETTKSTATPSDMSQEQRSELSPLEREILDFESKLWKKTAIKERAISTQLGITPIRYYQYLAALMERPEAAQYAPATVRRLSEALAARTAQRLL